MPGSKRGKRNINPEDDQTIVHSAVERLSQKVFIDDLLDEMSEMGFAEWSSRYRFIRGKSKDEPVKRISFEERRYLKTIYDDDSKDIVAMKGTQVGLTEYALSRALYWAAVEGLTVGYYLPTDKLARRIVQTRVYDAITLSVPLRKLAMASNAELISGKRPVRNVSIIQINRGVIHFSGAQAPTQRSSVDADAVILDEYDLFSPEAIIAIEDRLGGSQVQNRISISAPSIPGSGIALAFYKSDQRQYQYKCPACGEWRPLEFPASIGKIGKRWEFVCSRTKCGRPINRDTDDPKYAQWVAANASNPVHGYHVPGLLSPRRTAAYIQRRAKEASKVGGAAEEAFFRNILALVKVAGCDEFTPAMVEACVARGSDTSIEGAAYSLPVETSRPTVMGVDVGKVLHVVIFELPNKMYKFPRLVYAGTIGDGRSQLEETGELDRLMTRFNVKVACIDNLPEPRFALDFVRRWRRQAYRCSFCASNKKLVTKVDKESITSPRTDAYDKLYGDIERGFLYFPKNISELPDFLTHLTAVMRVYEELNNEPIATVYSNFGRPDHYASAAVLATIACEVEKGQRTGNSVLDYGLEIAKLASEPEGPSTKFDEDEFETKQEEIKKVRKNLDKWQDRFRNPFSK